MRSLFRALLLASPACLALLALAGTGHCSWLLAFAVTAVTVASGTAAWRASDGELAFLAETARRAGAPSGDDAPKPPGPARLPRDPVARVETEIDRLAAKLSDRAHLIETLLGAEEALVERLPDPLILLGADRGIRRANAAARDLFGAEIAAVLRHPALRAAIGRLLGAETDAPPAPGEPRTIRGIELAVASPVPRDLVASAIAFDPPLAGGGRILLVVSDRTRERAVERTRTDFIANASHELRTPLTSLIGFIETLRGPAADDPPAQARFLAIMADQAGRMNRLIDGLLSLSRVEVVEHVLPHDPVGLGAVLHRVAAGFEARIALRSQTLALALDPGPSAVRGDEDQLHEVFENLVENACKYGREGGRIAISLAPTALRGRRGFEVSVTDDGAGIARAHLPRLTERFYRVDAARGGAGGSGLGLAIVKHIVNRHRGTLAIESEPGAFTTVRIWLPAAE